MTNGFNFLIYKTPDKDVKVNAVIKDDTIWLTQKSMAELFGCSSDNISLHLKNIFEAGELEKIQLPRKSRQLPQMVKIIQQIFIILMLLFP